MHHQQEAHQASTQKKVILCDLSREVTLHICAYLMGFVQEVSQGIKTNLIYFDPDGRNQCLR